MAEPPIEKGMDLSASAVQSALSSNVVQTRIISIEHIEVEDRKKKYLEFRRSEVGTNMKEIIGFMPIQNTTLKDAMFIRGVRSYVSEGILAPGRLYPLFGHTDRGVCLSTQLDTVFPVMETRVDYWVVVCAACYNGDAVQESSLFTMPDPPPQAMKWNEDIDLAGAAPGWARHFECIRDIMYVGETMASGCPRNVLALAVAKVQFNAIEDIPSRRLYILDGDENRMEKSDFMLSISEQKMRTTDTAVLFEAVSMLGVSLYSRHPIEDDEWPDYLHLDAYRLFTAVFQSWIIEGKLDMDKLLTYGDAQMPTHTFYQHDHMECLPPHPTFIFLKYFEVEPPQGQRKTMTKKMLELEAKDMILFGCTPLVTHRGHAIYAVVPPGEIANRLGLPTISGGRFHLLQALPFPAGTMKTMDLRKEMDELYSKAPFAPSPREDDGCWEKKGDDVVMISDADEGKGEKERRDGEEVSALPPSTSDPRSAAAAGATMQPIDPRLALGSGQLPSQAGEVASGSRPHQEDWLSLIPLPQGIRPVPPPMLPPSLAVVRPLPSTSSVLNTNGGGTQTTPIAHSASSFSPQSSRGRQHGRSSNPAARDDCPISVQMDETPGEASERRRRREAAGTKNLGIFISDSTGGGKTGEKEGRRSDERTPALASQPSDGEKRDNEIGERQRRPSVVEGSEIEVLVAPLPPPIDQQRNRERPDRQRSASAVVRLEEGEIVDESPAATRSNGNDRSRERPGRQRSASAVFGNEDDEILVVSSPPRAADRWNRRERSREPSDRRRSSSVHSRDARDEVMVDSSPRAGDRWNRRDRSRERSDGRRRSSAHSRDARDEVFVDSPPRAGDRFRRSRSRERSDRRRRSSAHSRDERDEVFVDSPPRTGWNGGRDRLRRPSAAFDSDDDEIVALSPPRDSSPRAAPPVHTGFRTMNISAAHRSLHARASTQEESTSAEDKDEPEPFVVWNREKKEGRLQPMARLPPAAVAIVVDDELIKQMKSNELSQLTFILNKHSSDEKKRILFIVHKQFDPDDPSSPTQLRKIDPFVLFVMNHNGENNIGDQSECCRRVMRMRASESVVMVFLSPNITPTLRKNMDLGKMGFRILNTAGVVAFLQSREFEAEEEGDY